MAGNKMTIGNVEITSLSDGALEWDLCRFFPAIPEENWAPYASHLTAEHKARFNLASFLVRSDGKTIVVDTGLGPIPAGVPESPWGEGELLNDFRAKGVSLEDVDMVVMTHLHRDHVGWNLQTREGKYEPTFPNARYWMSAKDWEACHDPEMQPERFVNARECVWPLEDLGLVELMEGEQALTSELTTLLTPGHTPGHMSIMINSQGERGIILGDVVHSPVQIHETEWVARVDIDPEQTRATRRSMMERLEREGIPVAAAHLPAPGFGKIVRLRGRRVWQAF
jgi:glyoxylase-like metal-dependent hydrolase (beta-lactamase superfamily II)